MRDLFRFFFQREESKETKFQELKISGRVALGSGGLSGAGARSIAIRDQRGDKVLATVPLASDGTFSTAPLPENIRGTTVEISVINETGARSAEDVPQFTLEVPRSGDGYAALSSVHERATEVDSSPSVLNAEALSSMVKTQVASHVEFNTARGELAGLKPARTTDWKSAATLAEQLPKRQFGTSTLHVPGEEIAHYDRASVFTRPTAGVAGRVRTRVARVMLTASQRLGLSDTPTLCDAVLGGQQLRGFERRDRLAQQFSRQQRLQDIRLPEPPPSVTEPPPVDVDDTETVESLSESVEAAVLRRAKSVISDLASADRPTPGTATDLLRLRGIAEKLELSHGTANVSAAREVHTLRVAFHQDSTTILDPNLIKLIANLKELRVRVLNERHVAVAEPPDNPSEEQFIRYLTEVKQSLRLNSTEPVPKTVQSKYPHIGVASWAKLSDEAREVVTMAALRDARGKQTEGEKA